VNIIADAISLLWNFDERTFQKKCGDGRAYAMHTTWLTVLSHSALAFAIFWILRLSHNSPRMQALVWWPATVLHELSHFLVGYVLLAKPVGFSVFPARYKPGTPWQLGHVSFARLRWWNQLPVGLAPFDPAAAVGGLVAGGFSGNTAAGRVVDRNEVALRAMRRRILAKLDGLGTCLEDHPNSFGTGRSDASRLFHFLVSFLCLSSTATYACEINVLHLKIRRGRRKPMKPQ
jgi:hypothetical protein